MGIHAQLDHLLLHDRLLLRVKHWWFVSMKYCRHSIADLSGQADSVLVHNVILVSHGCSVTCYNKDVGKLIWFTLAEVYN